MTKFSARNDHLHQCLYCVVVGFSARNDHLHQCLYCVILGGFSGTFPLEMILFTNVCIVLLLGISDSHDHLHQCFIVLF